MELFSIPQLDTMQQWIACIKGQHDAPLLMPLNVPYRDAKGMFEMAQLAFLLDKEVNIAFHDTKIENGGHCVSTYKAILN